MKWLPRTREAAVRKLAQLAKGVTNSEPEVGSMSEGNEGKIAMRHALKKTD